MITFSAILQITRIDSSLLGFLAIFLSFFIRSKDLSLSLGMATPLLFICMCTFIANDIDDIEKDKINHPKRPLPAGHITTTFAVILYFTLLALSLFLTRYYVKQDIAFWYYGLIAVSISYNYIVEFIPSLKAIYVSIVSSIPIIIIAISYPNEARLFWIAVAFLLIITGREVLMDIKDRPGDPDSFIKKFSPKSLSYIAFLIQIIGWILLATIIHSLGDIISFTIIVSLLIFSGICWFKFANYKLSIILMKIQFFIGLYFLT